MTYRWVRAVAGSAALASFALMGTGCGRVISGNFPPGAKLAPPQGHVASVNCLAFSPDGRLLLSGSEDRTLLVWEVASRRLVQRLEGHEGHVSACAFVSERQAISAGWGGEIFLWDLTGVEKKRKIGDLQRSEAVYALALDPSKKEVLVGTSDGAVRGFDLVTGSRTFSPPEPQAPASSGKENTVQRYDKKIIRTVGYLDGTGAIQRFAANGYNVRVWRGEKESDPTPYDVTSGVPLSGGKLLLGGWEKLALWKPREQSVERVSWGAVEKGWVTNLAVNAPQDRVLVAYNQGDAQVWSFPLARRKCSLSKARVGLSTAAWDPTGQYLAVAGRDGIVHLANATACATGATLELLPLQAGRGRINAVATSDSRVLLGDGTGQVSAFDLSTWRGVWNRDVHAGQVMALAFLHDGRWVSGGSDLRVTLQGEDIGDKLQNQPRELVASSTSDAFWSADDAGNVTRWKLLPQPKDQPPKAEKKTFPIDSQPLYALAVHPNQQEGVVGGMLSHIARFANKHAKWASGTWPDSTTALAYDAAGKWLAQGSTGGDLLLRHAGNGNVQACLKRRSGEVRRLVFVGRQLWVGANDGHLARYSLPTDGELANPPAKCIREGTNKVDCLCENPLAPTKDIEEGSRVLDVAVTPDQRYLIAGLEDGRAAVHTLPNGELFAHLVTLDDGSWATLYADGHYEAWDTGAARTMLLELPDKRRVVRLDGQELSIEVKGLQATLQPDESSEIAATIFSPFGRPRVLLDGKWEMEGVYPSRKIANAYEMSFTLRDDSDEPHTIEVRVNDLPTKTKELPPLVSRKKTRALLIGNHLYDGTDAHRAEGADKDVQGMSALLQDARTFGLMKNRTLKVIENGEKLVLEQEITSFFENASKGETLIFYFSGHGTTRKDEKGMDEGILLANNYHTNPQENFITASFLWEAVKKSDASRVMIILDACRSASFKLPGDIIENQARANLGEGRWIGVLASAASDAPAGATPNGGHFTQAFIQGIQNPEPSYVDAETGAITLVKAKNSATYKRSELNPLLYGNLNNMIFAHIAGTQTSPNDVSNDVRGAEDWLKFEGKPKVIGYTYRQVNVQPSVQGQPGSWSLTIPVYFVHDTDLVHIVIHSNSSTSSPVKAELLENAGKATKKKVYDIPLRDFDINTKYAVTVTPCKGKSLLQAAVKTDGSATSNPPAAVCLKPSRKEFTFTL